MDFTNKVVLVTGASAGIGEAIALLFAKRGAKLSLVGRNEECLLDVARRCEQEKGLKPLAIVADLGTEEGCDRTAKQTLEHFERLDVLVNNAGVCVYNFIDGGGDLESFDYVFNINVRGVYDLTRKLVPALIESKGNIINISSVFATMVTVGNLSYSMAKAALDQFTRVAALELGPKGVRVNAVSPGTTVSKIVRRVTGYTEEQYQTWLGLAAQRTPLGKVCEGEDIAKIVVHLASEDSRMITGTVLPVDAGGLFMGALSKQDMEIMAQI